MRLISWNTAGRRKYAGAQVDYLVGLAPDLICLQEVTAGNVERLSHGLRSAGYCEIVHTIHSDHPRVGPRRYGLLIAARGESPLTVRPIPDIPWPERLLAAELPIAGGTATVLTTHIPPGSSNGWLKIDMLEAVARATRSLAGPLILCGDFNCPREERADGTVITWGQSQRSDGTVRIRRDHERWDAAERAIIEGLPASGLADAVRIIHGPEAALYSYYDIRKGRITASRRYDHAFATAHFRPLRAEYLDEPRGQRLSDHAPLLVELACAHR